MKGLKFKFDRHSVYVKYFLVLFTIFIIALIPLFRANYNYIDDMGRIREGYINFNFGRHTSDTIAVAVHDGSYLSDISPFTQILAAAIMALTCTLVIKILTRFRKDKEEPEKFNLWYVLAILPLGLSPYFMENYSYKFDAPYMALSILLSFVPILVYNSRLRHKNICFALATLVCTLLICTTYQASCGIFPAIVAIMALLMFMNREKWETIGGFVGVAAIAYCIGVVFFNFVIYESVDDYVNTGVLELSELIPGAIGHYLDYGHVLRIQLNMHWIVIMVIVYVGFVIACILRSKNNKLLSAILAILIAGFVGVMSFGLYPFIAAPLFAPRSMYGFFANFALIALVAVDYRHAYVAKVCALYLSYSFFIFALSYGNALAEQKHYADYCAELMMADLNEIGGDEEIRVSIDGDIGLSEPLFNLVEKYPLLLDIVPTMINESSWMWGGYYLYAHYSMPGVLPYGTLFNTEGLSPIKQTRLYDIYRQDNQVLIKIKVPDQEEALLN